MGEFAIDLSKFRMDTEKKTEQFVRKIAFEMYTLIVRRSPVDTGRFRANNQIALNDLPTGATMEVDKAGTGTIRKGNAILGQFKLGDTIFIYNNVEYALALEYGHSKQAPGGVFRVSFMDIKTHLDTYARTA